jgi:hypothetical protein
VVASQTQQTSCGAIRSTTSRDEITSASTPSSCVSEGFSKLCKAQFLGVADEICHHPVRIRSHDKSGSPVPLNEILKRQDVVTPPLNRQHHRLRDFVETTSLRYVGIERK